MDLPWSRHFQEIPWKRTLLGCINNACKAMWYDPEQFISRPRKIIWNLVWLNCGRLTVMWGHSKDHIKSIASHANITAMYNLCLKIRIQPYIQLATSLRYIDISQFDEHGSKLCIDLVMRVSHFDSNFPVVWWETAHLEHLHTNNDF